MAASVKQVETHTTGPWQSDNSHKYYDSWLIRHNGIAVARMMQDTTRSKEEWEANARLIAAAPELLEALKQARLAMNHHGIVGDPAQFMADVAIAKVEGA